MTPLVVARCRTNTEIMKIMRFSRNFPKSGKPTSTESPGTGVFEFSGAIWTPLDTLDSEFRAFLAASAIVSHVQN